MDNELGLHQSDDAGRLGRRRVAAAHSLAHPRAAAAHRISFPPFKFLVEACAGRLNLQAVLQGTNLVRYLKIRATIPGSEQFNSYSSERSFSSKGGVSTRAVTIGGYGEPGTVAPEPEAIVLRIRYPTVLRRERVKFTLKGLDLF